MHRINAAAGTRITIYHSFHAEVAVYKQHWWRCDGPCRQRPPFHGWVRRAMNRAPGPNDTWWRDHQAGCSGSFVKVREPEGFGEKKKKNTKAGKKAAEGKDSDEQQQQQQQQGGQKKRPAPPTGQTDIRKYMSNDSSSASTSAVACSDVQHQMEEHTVPPQPSSPPAKMWRPANVHADSRGGGSSPPIAEPAASSTAASVSSELFPGVGIRLGGGGVVGVFHAARDSNGNAGRHDDPLVDCPSCGSRVSQATVNQHLDVCLSS